MAKKTPKTVSDELLQANLGLFSSEAAPNARLDRLKQMANELRPRKKAL